jgi:hypothetical protein
MEAERDFLTQVSKVEGADGFLCELRRIHAEAGMTAERRIWLEVLEQVGG